jgi:hypothetical protein
LIQIKRNADFAVFSKTPLPAIANEAEVSATVDHKFIDMYPIFPTIDLKDEHVYNLQEPHLVGFRQKTAGGVQENVHTVYHINNDNLPNETDISRLIMFAFGTAYAQAQLLKQNNVNI